MAETAPSSQNRSYVYAKSGKVVLVIEGYHSIKDAEVCVLDTVRLVREHQSCVFVPDLRLMSGFDISARVTWQEHLHELRKHIRGLTMVGGSPLARMSGAAVCLYAGIKMRFADTIDQALADPPPR
ncbi:MAG: hypothetical protein U0271_00815 [Polyangiaceae bacterium]